MFTRCLRIFSTRSLLWRKPVENGERHLKAGENNRRSARGKRERLHCSRTELARVAGKTEKEVGRNAERLEGWERKRRSAQTWINRRRGSDRGAYPSTLSESLRSKLRCSLGGNGGLESGEIDDDARSKREHANSALRVMGDSLSGKFDFRLILGGRGVFARLNDGEPMCRRRKFKAAYGKSGDERRHESMM